MNSIQQGIDLDTSRMVAATVIHRRVNLGSCGFFPPLLENVGQRSGEADGMGAHINDYAQKQLVDCSTKGILQMFGQQWIH